MRDRPAPRIVKRLGGMRRVVVVDHDPAWAMHARAAGDELLAALAGARAAGAGDMVVHHIGSTSVPGLAAKPILDLLLEVPDDVALRGLEDARVVAALRQLGYEARGAYGIPGRRYFPRGGADRTHHVHAFVRGSDGAMRHLAFRDYLRAHPDVARAYGELKREVAAASEHDIDAYVDGKHAFVREHERRALAWRCEDHAVRGDAARDR